MSACSSPESAFCCRGPMPPGVGAGAAAGAGTGAGAGDVGSINVDSVERMTIRADKVTLARSKPRWLQRLSTCLRRKHPRDAADRSSSSSSAESRGSRGSRSNRRGSRSNRRGGAEGSSDDDLGGEKGGGGGRRRRGRRGRHRGGGGSGSGGGGGGGGGSKRGHRRNGGGGGAQTVCCHPRHVFSFMQRRTLYDEAVGSDEVVDERYDRELGSAWGPPTAWTEERSRSSLSASEAQAGGGGCPRSCCACASTQFPPARGGAGSSFSHWTAPAPPLQLSDWTQTQAQPWPPAGARATQTAWPAATQTQAPRVTVPAQSLWTQTQPPPRATAPPHSFWTQTQPPPRVPAQSLWTQTANPVVCCSGRSCSDPALCPDYARAYSAATQYDYTDTYPPELYGRPTQWTQTVRTSDYRVSQWQPPCPEACCPCPRAPADAPAAPFATLASPSPSPARPPPALPYPSWLPFQEEPLRVHVQECPGLPASHSYVVVPLAAAASPSASTAAAAAVLPPALRVPGRPPAALVRCRPRHAAPDLHLLPLSPRASAPSVEVEVSVPAAAAGAVEYEHLLRSTQLSGSYVAGLPQSQAQTPPLHYGPPHLPCTACQPQTWGLPTVRASPTHSVQALQPRDSDRKRTTMSRVSFQGLKRMGSRYT